MLMGLPLATSSSSIRLNPVGQQIHELDLAVYRVYEPLRIIYFVSRSYPCKPCHLLAFGQIWPTATSPNSVTSKQPDVPDSIERTSNPLNNNAQLMGEFLHQE